MRSGSDGGRGLLLSGGDGKRRVDGDKWHPSSVKGGAGKYWNWADYQMKTIILKSNNKIL